MTYAPEVSYAPEVIAAPEVSYVPEVIAAPEINATKIIQRTKKYRFKLFIGSWSNKISLAKKVVNV